MNKEKFLIIVCIIIVLSAVALRIFSKVEKQTAVPAVYQTATSTNIATPTNSATSTNVATSVNDENNSASTSEIIISSPASGALVTSPLSVSGQAKGNWFFEANLPVKLLDENDNIILAHFATATSDWMTTEFVPFQGELNFTTTSTTGYLLISKDNPSGLPENDAAIRIPVRFR